jgi:hypothetical protein
MAGARRLRQIRLRDCYQRLLTGARRWPDLFFVSITHESDAAKLEKFLPAYLRSNRHEMSDGERIKADYEMRREWRHIVSEVGLSDPDSEDGPFRSGTEQKPPWIGRYLDMRLFGESIEREWPEQEDDDDDSPRENFVNEEMARRITAFEGIAEICCLELKGKGYSLPANRTARTNIWLDAMMRFAPTLSTDGVKIRLGSVFWESLRFVEWVTDASHQERAKGPRLHQVS